MILALWPRKRFSGLPGPSAHDVGDGLLRDSENISDGLLACELTDDANRISDVMGYHRIPASLVVDGNGDGIKVFGIDTRRIPAQMVENQAIRDGSDHTLVSHSVCQKTTRTKPDHAIPGWPLRTLPLPAWSVVPAINCDVVIQIAAEVTSEETDRLPFDISESTISASRKRNGVSATAHAKTIGIGSEFVRVGMRHFLTSLIGRWGAGPRGVPAPPRLFCWWNYTASGEAIV